MAAGAGTVFAASQAKSLPLFLTGFVALFVLSGIGNGSTYKMIPAIFQVKAATEQEARRRASALIGLAGAIGAFGGVLVNMAFRQSFLATGNGDAAYLAFLAAYAVCSVVTWAVYLRPGSRWPKGI
jgi:NNP family nitrate/nitrite transporter-like MFS transporter